MDDFKSESIDIYPDSIDFINNQMNQIICQIIKMEDTCMRNAIIDYFKEYANKNKCVVNLKLLDEEQIKYIIDLGINEYIRRKNEK